MFKILALISALITVLGGGILVKRIILPYENGRHLDVVKEVVYDEGAIIVYGLFTSVFFLLTLLFYFFSKKKAS